MATITVTTLDDVIAIDGEVSLREAIQAANTDAAVNEATAGFGADTILFQSGLSGTITLTGDLELASSITIEGDDTLGIILAGDGTSRIFTNTSGAVTIELRNLMLTNGHASGDGGAILTGASAALTIVNSTISNNSATDDGGAIFSGGTLTVVNSTLSGNTAADSGGAVFAGSYAAFVNTTISGNSAATGGGIATGGIGSLAIRSSTITDNHASSVDGGGGIGLQDAYGFTLNSVLAGNTSGSGPNFDDLQKIVGGDFRAGYSFLGSDVDVDVVLMANSNLYGNDPDLGGLANNGGPRQTHAILADSPLIGTGHLGTLGADAYDIDADADTTEGLPVDAAGHARVQGNLDIGAFESDFGLTVTASDDNDDVLATLALDLNDGDGLTLREAIAHAAAGEKIGFDLALAGDTINLESALVLSQDITINGDIDGDGRADIGITGDDDLDGSQIFLVDSGADVELRSLFLAYGCGDGTNGGAISTALGTTLTMVNSSIVSSGTNLYGGALYLGGDGTIVNSIIMGNDAGRGGGIFVANGRSLNLINTTIAINYSDDVGGGIATGDNASVTAIQSTITFNYADHDGSGVNIGNGATFRAYNSVISGNYVDDISSSGSGTQLIAKSSLLGTGIAVDVWTPDSSVIIDDDPMFGFSPFGLGSFGGLFGNFNFAPLDGSPLVDAGDDTLVPDDDFDIDGDGDVLETLPLDGRGTPRIVGAHVDIGATEKLAFGDANGADVVVEDGDGTATGNALANDFVMDEVFGYMSGVVSFPGGLTFPDDELVGTYGSLTMLADGTWTYTLDNASSAVNALTGSDVVTDVFTYFAVKSFQVGELSQITITIQGHNDAPTAVADTLAATEDTAVTYTAAQLLGNDTDPDNIAADLSIASVTSGSGGVAVLNLDGTVTFTPTANATGPASFTYRVTDGTATSAAATANIQIAAVNDAPVITSNGGGASAAVSVAENGTAVTTVTATDSDVSAVLTFSMVGGADQSRFTIDATTGVLAFAAAPDFEAPTDVGGNNVYDIIVAVSDGSVPVTTQALAVTVTNVVGHTIIGGKKANTIDDTKPVGNATTGEEDTINGRGGNDTVTAGAGHDTLKGSIGDDVLNGGTGNDWLKGGTNKDLLRGGSGIDTADYSDKAASVVLTLNGKTVAIANIGGVDEDKVKSVENVIGGTSDDVLTGDSKANYLKGGKGNDSLDGARESDTLEGNRGNDTINGGRGNDTLTGGADSDIFVFDTRLGAANVDAITDFRHDIDVIQLDGTIFAAIGPTLDAAEFFAKAGAIKAKQADHRLIYNTTTGDLYFDADGKGGAASVLFATLTTKPPLFDAGDVVIV